MRIVAAAAIAAFALAACQPAEKPAETAATPTAEELGQDDPNIPFKPAPVGPPKSYDATSKTAMSFTPGKMTMTETPQASENLPSGMVFKFDNGIEYRTTLMPGGATQGAKPLDFAPLFPGAADFDPEKVVMYSVDSETVPTGTPNGGFCDKTSFIATYTVMSPGAEDITLAAFSGDKWPPDDDKVLCGTFMYSFVH